MRSTDSKLDAAIEENRELKDLLFSHFYGLAAVIRSSVDCGPGAEVMALLPMEITRPGLTSLSDRTISLVREKLKASQVVKEGEAELGQCREAMNTSSESDLKRLFDEGQNLLRLNRDLLEAEKVEIDSSREELERERAELEEHKRRVLNGLVSGHRGPNPDWSVVEEGPLWSLGNPAFTVVTSGDPADLVTSSSGLLIGPDYNSRPPSRCPSSSRNSPAPARNVTSSSGSSLRRRRRHQHPQPNPNNNKGNRPRSATFSPQRLKLKHPAAAGPPPSGIIRPGSMSPGVVGAVDR